MAGNKPKRKVQTKVNTDPLMMIIGKQRVGQDDADEIALPVLVHLDAAKRGQGPALGQQHLYQHLLIAQILAARLQNRPLYDAAVAGCDALMKASRRPTKLLDLATSEYLALRKAFSYYLRALPLFELGMFAKAGEQAANLMATMPNEAA